MKASETQIGGGHYAKFKIQPTEFIYVNNVPFIEGNIIKYVMRHKDKNGIEDLKKAKHYIELLIQYEYENA
ncbi:SaV-like [uncultured Caudovirales phage]|uniref:SaV-like n=1 Tax=uncultured Caudovirales phage TaxID=2100421 RepID=A0A6J5N240_9CAUD|nr:SaV-like [uncultured Caudovirales phage]